VLKILISSLKYPNNRTFSAPNFVFSEQNLPTGRTFFDGKLGGVNCPVVPPCHDDAELLAVSVRVEKVYVVNFIGVWVLGLNRGLKNGPT